MRIFEDIRNLLRSSASNAEALGDLCQEVSGLRVIYREILELERKRFSLEQETASARIEYLKASGELSRAEISAVRERASIKPGKHDDEF